MEFTKYDMFAYQLLDYLVIEHHYQIIRVQQHSDDIWLMNAMQEYYPVIRILSKRQDETEHDYIRNVHHIIMNLIQREGPIITLNTNPDNAPIHDQTMTQITITATEISDDKILNTFHKLKEVVHESDDMDTEIANLTKEIEEVELARSQHVSKHIRKNTRPWATWGIIFICIVMSVVPFVISLFVHDDITPFVAMGAYYKMNVVAAHEYWRLLTAGFIMPDIFTMAISMLIVFYIGKVCEGIMEVKHYVSIVLISIVVGNLFSLVGDQNIISMGIGSGVFGMFGAYIAHITCNRIIRHPLMQFTLVKLGVLVFAMMLLPGLSLLNFFGGFCAGTMLGILFYKADELQTLRRNTLLSSLLLLIVLLGIGISKNTCYPIDKEFDSSLLQLYKETPMKGYAQYLEKCYNKQYRLE